MDAKEITGRLRLAKPHTLRVFSADREDADLIAVSTKRDRWKRCNVVLDAMCWTRIECLDSKNKILDTIQQDDEEEEGPGGKKRAPESEEERWLGLMINAQRLALQNNADMIQPLVDGYVKLADVFGARLAALEKHFDRTLDVAYQNAILQAQVDGGPDMDTEVIKMLMDKMGDRKPTKRAVAKLAAKNKSNGAADATSQ